MEIKILELEKMHLRCIIKGVTPAFMNTIRRTLVSVLPKMAIHEVQFNLGPIRGSSDSEEMYESTTPLFNEIIAHRLGMLPVPTDTLLFNFKDECVCEGEGCPNCEIMYLLNKQGPCTVYSGDLEPIGDVGANSSKYEVVEKLVPIVKLGPSQALLVYAIARLGRGKTHAKYQVCAQVGYKYFPHITIDKTICDNGGGCIDICHKNVLGFNTKGEIAVNNPLECDICQACVEICVPQVKRGINDGAPHKAIKIDSTDDMFIFNMVTDGSYTAKEAFEKALETLKKETMALRTAIAGNAK